MSLVSPDCSVHLWTAHKSRNTPLLCLQVGQALDTTWQRDSSFNTALVLP